jgi:flagellin-like hook-associated protein FlgL
MSIVPTSYQTRSYAIRQLGDMRDQLDALQRQMATGKRAETNAALGSERNLSLVYRQQTAEVSSYLQTIDLAETRLKVIASTLTRITKVGTEAKGALDPNLFLLQTDGKSTGQQAAMNYLQELVALFNADVADRRIFAGKAVDVTPVEKIATLFDGDGGKAGLRQIIAERRAADLGADGLGRLIVPAVAGDTVSIFEEADGLPFGFKLQAVNSNLNGVTLGGPSGSPPSVSIALAARPQVGQTVSIQLGLPDGTSHMITLTVALEGGPDQFAVGADVTETAGNLRDAVIAALEGAGQTALGAASALQASTEFFASGGNPAQRVDGPPFESAVALRDATDTDTVAWYKGDNSAGDPRADSLARVDKNITVAYGLRANEPGFSAMIANLAALIADDFSASTDADSGRSSELTRRVRVNLEANTRSVNATSMEIAGAQIAMEQARERLTTTQSMLAELTEKVEGVDINETSANLLSLQSRIQASYEATAILFKLNLADYL